MAAISIDEDVELVRHWRRRARVAELAGQPLRVDVVAAAEIRRLQAWPPAVVLRPGGMTAFGLEVAVAGAEGAPEA